MDKNHFDHDMFKSGFEEMCMSNATFAENQKMYTGLTHLHSANRYLIVGFLLITCVDALLSLNKPEFNPRSKTFALITLILVHIQAAIGLVQYFLSPWFSALMENPSDVMSDAHSRFFAVEHWLIMIAAVILITAGYSKSKRIEDPSKRYRSILIFYTIGLVLIFGGIPWPFLRSFGTWI